ncbi:MAG: hypothetical protein ACOYJR_05715 [Acutalibacteraceae bacterium]|jgi:hypothetical protein
MDYRILFDCFRTVRFFRRKVVIPLHAFGAFSFSLFLYCILDDFIPTGGSLLFRSLFIFLLGNTLGVFFELLEMLHDTKKKKESKSQKGLRDTDMDMIFNLFGSAPAGLFAYFRILM